MFNSESWDCLAISVVISANAKSSWVMSCSLFLSLHPAPCTHAFLSVTLEMVLLMSYGVGRELSLLCFAENEMRVCSAHPHVLQVHIQHYGLDVAWDAPLEDGHTQREIGDVSKLDFRLHSL